jgi:hypothetical protein
MRDALNELNRRLMMVLDREHRIGHAYFMAVDSPQAFNTTFEWTIVPLLQEFFYNDWDGLRAALGERGQGNIVRAVPEIEGVRPRTRFAWWRDLDLPTPDFLAALCANYAASPAVPFDDDNSPV